jgi:hypothetical protein
MPTRRTFLQGTLTTTATTAASGWGIPFLWSKDPGTVKSAPDVIIHDGTYPGWPWVATGADGTFYCVFHEGTAHSYSPTGRVGSIPKTWYIVANSS